MRLLILMTLNSMAPRPPPDSHNWATIAGIKPDMLNWCCFTELQLSTELLQSYEYKQDGCKEEGA